MISNERILLVSKGMRAMRQLVALSAVKQLLLANNTFYEPVKSHVLVFDPTASKARPCLALVKSMASSTHEKRWSDKLDEEIKRRWTTQVTVTSTTLQVLHRPSVHLISSSQLAQLCILAEIAKITIST